MDKIIDGVDVSKCKHYRAEIETKMPYGEYEIQKDKCHYSGIEIIQDCKGIKDCIYKQLKRLQAKYDNLQVSHSILKTAYLELQEENERLEAELKKYEDMAKKGLEEFKDVGGCWGCGLQLQLNQDMEDIKKLKAENEKLKTDIGIYKGIIDSDKEENERLKKELKDYKTSKENSYQNLQKEWQQLQWDIRKLTTEN